MFVASGVLSCPAVAADPAEDAEKRERQIVAATQAAIEKHRKADAKIRVVDAAGRPVSGAKVSVEQTGHDFLFGCNIYDVRPLSQGRPERRLQEALRGAVQLRHGRLLLAVVRAAARQAELRLHRQGRRLVPGTRHSAQRAIRCSGATRRACRPGPRASRRPKIQRQRVADIMQRYQGKIEFWEVVNEPSHLAQPKIDEPYRWARQADPQAYLIVNDYHVLADGCPGFFKLLTAAKQSGVPFDGIGIQAHEPRTMRFPLDRVQRDSRPVRHAGQGTAHHRVHAHLRPGRRSPARTARASGTRRPRPTTP